MKHILTTLLILAAISATGQTKDTTQKTTTDTIPVIMIVTDTASVYPRLMLAYGYEVRNAEYVMYLNQLKKPFDKRIIIWQAKSTKP